MLKCTEVFFAKKENQKQKNKQMNKWKYIQGQSRELRWLSATPGAQASPCLFIFALSLSIQRNMYNYKGYKKGSNINRQIY